MQFHSVSSVSFDIPITFAEKLRSTPPALMDAPKLERGVKNHPIAQGVFPKTGPYAGEAYEIILVHPRNAKAAHELSAIVIEAQRRQGKENSLARTAKKFEEMSHIDMQPDRIATGGLLFGIAYKNTLISMGGIALLADFDDGRGNVFDKCPINKQIHAKAVMTHPAYEGNGLASALIGERINAAVKMSEQFDRSHLVVKVIKDSRTDLFYQDKKIMGFIQNGEPFILPQSGALLLTLGQNMDAVKKWLVDTHPDIAESDFALDNLPRDYVVSKPALKVA